MPDAWFEDQGVELTDTPQAIFIHDGQPALALFIRASKIFTVPMAVGPTRPVRRAAELGS